MIQFNIHFTPYSRRWWLEPRRGGYSSDTLVTLGPFRILARRQAGSQRVFGCTHWQKESVGRKGVSQEDRPPRRVVSVPNQKSRFHLPERPDPSAAPHLFGLRNLFFSIHNINFIFLVQHSCRNDSKRYQIFESKSAICEPWRGP